MECVSEKEKEGNESAIEKFSDKWSAYSVYDRKIWMRCDPHLLPYYFRKFQNNFSLSLSHSHRVDEDEK